MILVLTQDRPVPTACAPAMREATGLLPGPSPIAGKPVHAAFDGGRPTSDAGVLVLAEIERRLGLAERLARCIEDPRAPEQVRHTVAEMIRFRALLIAAGYSDADDCDALRTDPAFKMAVGRLPESGADLCSQPTMSRLENLPGAIALKRMMAAMVELDRLHRSSLRQLRRGAAPDRARHRRHRGSRPAAFAVPRSLDSRFIVTNLRGSPQWLDEEVYCARGQAENLIQAHKRHLASDRTSCSKATANQFRLLIHTAAYWLLHSLRGLAPKTSFWRDARFDTIRLALI
jgi:hypothetical protein